MYAQVRKSDNVVSLIGGVEVGLPIEHPDVLCIDIGENKEGIEVNWTYDSETKTFKYIPLVVENTSIEREKEKTEKELIVELREEQKKENLLLLRTLLEAVEEITSSKVEGGTE